MALVAQDELRHDGTMQHVVYNIHSQPHITQLERLMIKVTLLDGCVVRRGETDIFS